MRRATCPSNPLLSATPRARPRTAGWGWSPKRCREFSSFFVRKTRSIWGRAGAARFISLTCFDRDWRGRYRPAFTAAVGFQNYRPTAPPDESYSNSVDALSVLKPGADSAADRVIVLVMPTSLQFSPTAVAVHLSTGTVSPEPTISPVARFAEETNSPFNVKAPRPGTERGIEQWLPRIGERLPARPWQGAE